MTKEQLAKKKLPEEPGVYFFLGAKKKILYIGKATNLQSRVGSYFAKDIREKRSPLIEKLVEEAKTVEWTTTDSTLEALILETNLIRTHKPTFNTRSKDDKSYNHLVITAEEWPRVLVVRGKDMATKFEEGAISYHFGPFPNGQLFREALKIIRKLFKFYDTKQEVGSAVSKFERGKINFNQQIGLYPKDENRKEYLKTIRHIQLLFEGNKKQIVVELHKDMMAKAKKEEFEQAEILKRKIYALEHIQDVALIGDDNRVYRDDKTLRIEAYDVAHMAGEAMVGVMTVVENSLKAPHEYKKFNIKTVTKSNDPAALSEMLNRRFAHKEWPSPQLIVVDGSVAQKNVAERVLKKFGLVIPVLAIVKDEHHNPKRILGVNTLKEKFTKEALLANAEAHRFAITFHRKKSTKNWLPAD